MAEYIELGHANMVDKEEREERSPKRWFLPHHRVRNPNKPGKTPVVFDAAAEHQGVSLYKCLLKGHDLLINLFAVLIRFRRYHVPVIGDIIKMFHQVRLKKQERSTFNFFWRTLGCQSGPEIFQMAVHIFGAVSSPTTCMFALNRCAEDHRHEFPDDADLVRSAFYVDNYLDSTETEIEAIERCKALHKMLQLGGFELAQLTNSGPGGEGNIYHG